MIYSKHNYAQRPDSKTFGLVIRLHPLTFRHTVIFSMAWENNGSFVCLSYPFSVFVRCWGFQMWAAERRLSTGVRHVTWGRLQVWLSCRLPDTVRPRDLRRYTRLWFYLPSFINNHQRKCGQVCAGGICCSPLPVVPLKRTKLFVASAYADRFPVFISHPSCQTVNQTQCCYELQTCIRK